MNAHDLEAYAGIEIERIYYTIHLLNNTNEYSCTKSMFLISFSFAAETKLHVPTDDDFLIMFLRPCKYYAKSAFQRVSQ